MIIGAGPGARRWIYQMRFVAVTIGIVLLCGPASAQQADPTALVLSSRNAYFDCVLESVMAQLKQMPSSLRSNADYSFLGEQAFLACATEERVLGMILTDNTFHRKCSRQLCWARERRLSRSSAISSRIRRSTVGFPNQTTTSGIECEASQFCGSPNAIPSGAGACALP